MEKLDYDIEKLIADHVSGDGLAPIEIDFLFQRIRELEAKAMLYGCALSDIKKHQMTIGGNMAQQGTIYRIADTALGCYNENTQK